MLGLLITFPELLAQQSGLVHPLIDLFHDEGIIDAQSHEGVTCLDVRKEEHPRVLPRLVQMEVVKPFPQAVSPTPYPIDVGHRPAFVTEEIGQFTQFLCYLGPVRRI